MELDEKVYGDSGLGKWFNKEKWVDISRKNKDGSHPPCGASAGKGKRKEKHFSKYPKCVKKTKADSMSAEEKKSAVQRKRKDVKKDKNKSTPTYTKTDKNESLSIPYDILIEYIEKDDVARFEPKTNLSPTIWYGKDGEYRMHKNIRKALLLIAQSFLKMNELDDMKYTDITLTGSLANYNHRLTSDIDLHIVMDTSQISDDEELVEKLTRKIKNEWNKNYPIKIKNHPVELYIQDENEKHMSDGVYSIIRDQWVVEPTKNMLIIDSPKIIEKANKIVKQIQDLENIENGITLVNQIDSLFERLKRMRAAGLSKDGEFSTENLVFKLLRDGGYLNDLMDRKKELITKELTVETFFNTINEGRIDVKSILNKAKKTGIITIGLIVGLLAAEVSKDEILQHGVSKELVLKAQNFLKDAQQKADTTFNLSQ